MPHSEMPHIASIVAGTRLKEIKDFYLTCGYAGLTEPEDDVVIAVLDNHIVGIVRLVNELGCYVLRGMNLRDDWQRRGLGSKILAEFEKLLIAKRVSSVFLTCGPFLESFYAQIGFCIADQVPDFLEKRKAGYELKYGKQIVMCRQSIG